MPSPERRPITTLFFDIGGVLLSNAWESASRQKAVAYFGLDLNEFERRHVRMVSDFEKGKIRLRDYLDAAVFDVPRNFSKREFIDFMYAESVPYPDSLQLLARLAAQRNHLLVTVNNESYELNLYRIESFGLARYFTAFFSSCFLGLRKPDPAIYRTVLEITHRNAEECLVIDDRDANLAGAAECGLPTLLFKNAAQCEQELQTWGVL